MNRGRLICLLPVRNGEADLPGYLESVEKYVDGVVALDDGSTDRTLDILESSPIVKILLTNPQRPDYAGWDDAENRGRLLEAAAQLDPDWVISLDADERIPADDAAALREFLDTDAMPGLAYGFKVYRMWNDLNQFDRSGLWVYRLFPFQPGLTFPTKRHHFVPIPTQIARQRWVRTTIRIQHLAGLTELRRQARFDKWQQVDPDNEYQHSYRDLIEPVLNLRAWEPRHADLPVLDVSLEEVDAALDDAQHPPLDDIVDHPALSAIIISRDDGARILPAVASVVAQECPWPFEVIVVTSGKGNAADMVRARFPQVTVIDLPNPALPGEARNAGLRVATGEYVSYPGSHVELKPGSLAARLRAHDLGYAMVTGTVLNGTRTWAGWASYFLDHSTVLPGRPSIELRGAPAHCSYRRNALESVGGFPEDMRAGEDTVVNQALVRRGYTAYRAQDVTLVHKSPCRTVPKLIRHHFARGRGYGRILRERDAVTRAALLGATGRHLLHRQLLSRVRGITQNVDEWGSETLQSTYRKVRPLVMI